MHLLGSEKGTLTVKVLDIALLFEYCNWAAHGNNYTKKEEVLIEEQKRVSKAMAKTLQQASTSYERKPKQFVSEERMLSWLLVNVGLISTVDTGGSHLERAFGFSSFLSRIFRRQITGEIHRAVEGSRAWSCGKRGGRWRRK